MTELIQNFHVVTRLVVIQNHDSNFSVYGGPVSQLV